MKRATPFRMSDNPRGCCTASSNQSIGDVNIMNVIGNVKVYQQIGNMSVSVLAHTQEDSASLQPGAITSGLNATFQQSQGNIRLTNVLGNVEIVRYQGQVNLERVKSVGPAYSEEGHNTMGQVEDCPP